MATNIYTALAAAQAEMGPVVKGSTNPHFKSKYADLADVVEAARPVLNKHGITYYHYMDGQHMVTALVHGESETRIECSVPLVVDKNNMQGMKSATTYAKRIGLESVTGIAPEDDDGNAAAKAAPKRQVNPRSDLPEADPAKVDEFFQRVQEIMSADIDEYDTADKIREVHADIVGDQSAYVALMDRLVAEKVITKKQWREYMALHKEGAA